MKLTQPDEKLVNRVLEILERNPSLSSFDAEKIPDSILSELFQTEVSDIDLLGLYTLHLLEKERNIEALVKDGTVNRILELFTVQQQHMALRDISTVSDLTSALKSNQRSINVAKPSKVKVATLQSMTIIVHGTAASNKPWWQKGGDFYEYVDDIVDDLYVGSNPFRWSGGNFHSHRKQGAKDLKQWADRNPTKHLDIIAHSHGGNVCFAATQYGLKVRKLILLGTPIRLEYIPDLSKIDQLVNVFSTHDWIQKPGTIPNRRAEGRTLGDSKRVINVRADRDGHGGQPWHTELHEEDTWVASNIEHFLTD